MRLTVENCSLINSKSICIHDYIVIGLVYKYSDDKIKLYLKEPISNVNYEIEFDNVLGFKAITCDFWGSSPHVLDWEVQPKEEHEIVKEICEKQLQYRYTESKWNPNKEYIESVITLSSGDIFSFVCEQILFSIANNFNMVL